MLFESTDASIEKVAQAMDTANAILLKGPHEHDMENEMTLDTHTHDIITKP